MSVFRGDVGGHLVHEGDCSWDDWGLGCKPGVDAMFEPMSGAVIRDWLTVRETEPIF